LGARLGTSFKNKVMNQLRELIADWNTTGKIKAIVIGLLAVMSLFNPLRVNGRLETALAPFIIGIIMIPLIAKFNQFFLNKEIVKPIWNDNPFVMKRPLIMFHTFSIFFLVSGLSMVIGTGVKYQELNVLGLTAISFGLGMILGIRLTRFSTNS
jgi:hypothetical protein